MPRYFFDFTVDGVSTRDDEGVELPSIECARREALAALGAIAKDELPKREPRELKVVVRDDETPVLAVCFSVRAERLA